jgi:hypothetical protein
MEISACLVFARFYCPRWLNLRGSEIFNKIDGTFVNAEGGRIQYVALIVRVLCYAASCSMLCCSLLGGSLHFWLYYIGHKSEFGGTNVLYINFVL